MTKVMLRSSPESCTSSSPRPQDVFRRVHARLACPPLLDSVATGNAAPAAPYARVVDPYHFIVCQHGVLGSAADFENLITDSFVSHEVSVLEATETRIAVECQRTQGPHSQQSKSMHNTTHVPPSVSALADESTSMDGSVPTDEHRARCAAYRASYRLSIEYPNRTNGRLYRSGNFQCFSPGSNEYLNTDAGTLVCARRMLAEVVPALHMWLDEVQSKEQHRQEMWASYARAMGTDDAARLSAEASAALPICFSVMAHSFGGILQREFLFLLLVDELETRETDVVLSNAVVALRQRFHSLHVTFENFLTVATPHCGARECLWWPMYVGAWCLARMNLCKTYDELLLSDSKQVLQRRLLDEPHLRVLQLFRRRVLFANTHGDMLVGFGTCSLIFESVDTDHTIFIGVAPHSVHCAAAFASDTAEVSKPILLRSFDDIEEEGAHCCTGKGEGCRFQGPISKRTQSYTLDDLLSPASPLSATTNTNVRSASYSSASENTDSPLHVAEGGSGGSDLLRERRKSQATSSCASGLVTSLSSSLSSHSCFPMLDSDSLAGLQVSSLAASLTIRSTAEAHNKKAVRVEDVAGSWADRVFKDIAEDTDSEEQSVSALTSTAGMRCSQPLRQLCRRSTGSLYSGLLGLFMRGGTSPGASMSSLGKPSGIERNTALLPLRDPRRVYEHVRGAASTLHAALRRRLRVQAASSRAHQTSGLDTPTAKAEEPEKSVMVPSERSPQAVSVTLPRTPRSSGTETRIPRYRRAPRAIAATLRRKMSWQVRAIRMDSILPTGHVSCLGNWAFFGRSPSVVEAIAEELLIIL